VFSSLTTCRTAPRPHQAPRFPLAGAAQLDLGHAVLQPARADDDLARQADQVHGGKLRARALVAVVVEHLDALGLERPVDGVAGPVGLGIARLQIDQPDAERRHRLGPDDAGLVMARLDDGAGQPRHADAVGPRLHRRRLSVGPLHDAAERLGILGAEKEDMTDLDAAARQPARLRHPSCELRSSCFSSLAAYFEVNSFTTAATLATSS
jgi:hypothetical protein